MHGIKYSHVCGKVDKTTDAFNHPERCTNIIDGNYINGVSIIHGYYSSKHVWTFVAAHFESDIYPVTVVASQSKYLN